MAHLQIRDIPDDVRDVLAQRAQDRGQSPNAYLREVIVREALFANNQAPDRPRGRLQRLVEVHFRGCARRA
jgi:plasmid stability protein